MKKFINIIQGSLPPYLWLLRGSLTLGQQQHAWLWGMHGCLVDDSSSESESEVSSSYDYERVVDLGVGSSSEEDSVDGQQLPLTFFIQQLLFGSLALDNNNNMLGYGGCMAM
ncbi:hypothetical protein ACFE04_020663 [Oxalis oulophora]